MRDKILKHQHQLETCQKELKFQGFLFSGCIFGTLILLLHTKYGWYDILFDPCRALVFNNSLKPHWVEYPISILDGIVGLATHCIESSRPDQVVMLLLTGTIEMYKCIYYWQLSAQCGGWRIQYVYNTSLHAPQCSSVTRVVVVTTWPDTVHTAVGYF